MQAVTELSASVMASSRADQTRRATGRNEMR